MLTKERIGEVEGVLTAFEQLAQRVEGLLKDELDEPGAPGSERSTRAGTLRKVASDLYAQRGALEALWS